ncbi:MAG: deoxyribose-phosphate aldolase [Calditrichaeota bacterium]|nr:deoxyribose-phosphate aldolase [Calditrichota bacterium]RQW02880.1 MAG: deoxyribose-phosphate aldolase [Calditrichota bacterium]
MDREKFPKYFDHTLLRPNAPEKQIREICEEALKYRFASVCINPVHVPICAQLLKNSGIKVCTVIGFPLGATLTQVKAVEARKVMQLGAEEIDMVLNIGALKDSNYDFVYQDIFEVVKEARLKNARCKVILETGLLTDDEKKVACGIAKKSGAHFVKTSTGFGPGGATVEDVILMMEAVMGSRVQVKASGGIRSFAEAVKMIEAGASRLGTSATVKIMQEYLREIQ